MSSEELEIDERAVDRIIKALKVWQQPNMDKVLRRATSAGAGIFRNPMREAAPVKRGPGGAHGSGYGEPGDLRGSIKVERISRGGGVASRVGPFGRRAFARFWVVKGTKAHVVYPRAQANRPGMSLRTAFVNVAEGKHHALRMPDGGYRASARLPASKPNPFIARIGHALLGDVRTRMIKVITRAAQKEGLNDEG